MRLLPVTQATLLILGAIWATHLPVGFGILAGPANSIQLSPANSIELDSVNSIELDGATRDRCLQILRNGLNGITGDDFWPAIHAAEGLTLGGYQTEVIARLTPLLDTETDDQRRCGLARELVRAGDVRKDQVMLQILAGDDPYGHVHAAESLYKVFRLGDGRAMRHRYTSTANLRLKLMTDAALGRGGNPHVMPFLRQMLKHEDPELSKVAAWILGRIGSKADIPLLRAELPRCREQLTLAYFHHSLAALGDEEGLQRLSDNLTSDDPAVRTYAATFAGDAWAVQLQPQLTAMLHDSHPDAAIRAAQSLLQMSQPAPADPAEDISTIVFPASAMHPRNSEGSVVELADGSLLLAVTQFMHGGSDFDKAHVVASRSFDDGRTWSQPRILQPNTGDMNVMSVTLRRLASSDRIAMFYLQKNGHDDLDLYVRFSDDEAASFGDPQLITAEPGYHVINNDRVLQLSSGRLLVPAASTPDVKTVNHFVCHCYVSDDEGQSWRAAPGSVDAEKRGAMEPELVELNDGRIMMLIRNQLGFIGKSYSADGGETWSSMESLGLQSPEAPCTVRRIPSTGDLLLIWNNTFTPGAGHGGKRTPLTAAISSDDGQTWQVVGNLETDPVRTYSYTSLTFVNNRAVMSYWDNSGRDYSCRFRSIPVSWFTTPSDSAPSDSAPSDPVPSDPVPGN